MVSLIAASASSSLAACTEKPPTELPADSSTVGESLSYATEELTAPVLVTYELSLPVVGVAASYSSTDDGATEDGDWTVIVDCSDAQAAVVGIIPSSRVSAKGLEQALEGKFDHLLVECE